jgi:hypothetical protein
MTDCEDLLRNLPIIIISLTIIFSGLVNTTYALNETSTYENMTEGIKFQYPSYWGSK